MDLPFIVEFKPVERKRRDLKDFSQEQIYYLDMLSKFTGRQSQAQNVRIEDKPSHKEIVVKEYFNYLSVNEQVQWNDMKATFHSGTQNSLYLTGGSFISGCLYYLMTTPNTKSLGFQAVKSGCASILVGFGYYKICQARYHKDLHTFYILTLDRVKDRRRRILNS